MCSVEYKDGTILGGIVTSGPVKRARISGGNGVLVFGTPSGSISASGSTWALNVPEVLPVFEADDTAVQSTGLDYIDGSAPGGLG